MSNFISAANFSVSGFSAGASTFSSMVAANYVISGYRLLVQNETGGSASITAQFWQGEGSDKTALGDPVNLEITESSPPGNSIIAPEKATMVVIVFGKITFPMGTVVLNVSAGS